jgi:hypothetical protein
MSGCRALISNDSEELALRVAFQIASSRPLHANCATLNYQLTDFNTTSRILANSREATTDQEA